MNFLNWVSHRFKLKMKFSNKHLEYVTWAIFGPFDSNSRIMHRFAIGLIFFSVTFIMGTSAMLEREVGAQPTRGRVGQAPQKPPTPQFVEGQVSVVYEDFALLPDSPVDPGRGLVDPVRGKTLPYKNMEDYKRFLKKREGFLKSEGERLKCQYGVTVLSTNIVLGTQLLKIPEEKSIDEAVKMLKNDPRIKEVGKNFIGFGDNPPQSPPPNETKWTSGDLWGMVKIGMKDVWPMTQNQGHEEIVVAVIDSGFDLTHPDLSFNLWTNPHEIPGNSVDDPQDGNGIIDDVHGADWCNMQNGQPSGNPTIISGHGTEVAGIIGATGNNGTAAHVAGMNWVVKLMSLKTLCSFNNNITVPRAAAAITYAVLNGAHIINNSYGIYSNNPPPELSVAINLANCQGSAVPPGCQPALLVASAGNDNINIDNFHRYPASYAPLFNHVISVAAVEESDLLFWPVPANSDYASNWGSSNVSIAAPGNLIHTLFPIALDPMDTSGLGVTEATSAAAPFVSGCAAILQAKRREISLPLLPPGQIKEIIMEGGDQVSNLRICGGGTQDCVVQGRRLNCLQAFYRLPVCSGSC